MKDGFIKVAAASLDLKVADCGYNTEKIIEAVEKAEREKVKVLVLPELAVTGYTAADLFCQKMLLENAKKGLAKITAYTAGKDVLVFIGLPFVVHDKLYNTAVAVQNGRVLGIIPKHSLPNYSEFYEARHFAGGNRKVEKIELDGHEIPFGMNQIFECKYPEFSVAAEICEDLWTAVPPSGFHALAGAQILVNLSASDETTGKDVYRRNLVKAQSARCLAAYIYATAGEGESTQDLVFGGQCMIAENGNMLAEAGRFENGMVITEIDVEKLVAERRKTTTFINEFSNDKEFEYERVCFELPSLGKGKAAGIELPETKLTRKFDKAPFVPSDITERDKRSKEIIMIQAMGLKKRLLHTGCKNVVIGISGGLDSTLALLVACKAFDLAGIDRKGIIAVTMPCFGTTDRTYNNAVELIKELGATLKEVRLEAAVRQHFKDIEHDEAVKDVIYENSQARERTQVLMDLSNKYNGLVIGTGDLSELALGWATYNGDHMSMYGVNASVPKTLVRYLVSYFAGETDNKKLSRVLKDILATPVSPELIPPENGNISQKTEDLVGPYELHDFFIYNVLRFGFTPSKVYRMAVEAFDGVYEKDFILKWLKTFYRRFFSQQFKRSCLPDGPKVGSIAVSPRGDLRMPSDAVSREWLEDLQ